jgi:cytochrome P450
LKAEIRATFAHESEVTKFAYGNQNQKKLRSCLYLQACIRETMRLVPAVADLSPRLVRPGGMEIEGVFVPHGTHIGGSLFTVLRDETQFQNPDKFFPQRWMPEIPSDPKNLKSHEGFIPFGTGLHSCVRQSLAKLQLELTVVRTLLRYNLSLKGQANESAAFPFKVWAVAKGTWQIPGDDYTANLAKKSSIYAHR